MRPAMKRTRRSAECSSSTRCCGSNEWMNESLSRRTGRGTPCARSSPAYQLSAPPLSIISLVATPRSVRVRKVRPTISWTIFINLICSDEKTGEWRHRFPSFSSVCPPVAWLLPLWLHCDLDVFTYYFSGPSVVIGVSLPVWQLSNEMTSGPDIWRAVSPWSYLGHAQGHEW